mmetsp:Transcript_93294/g.213279  ORF Transcript_93294/g.213279 Transcript_93294/m.213279 type:complete len:472 (-) Transcript_93294:1681-3096(-)
MDLVPVHKGVGLGSGHGVRHCVGDGGDGHRHSQCLHRLPLQRRRHSPRHRPKGLEHLAAGTLHTLVLVVWTSESPGLDEEAPVGRAGGGAGVGSDGTQVNASTVLTHDSSDHVDLIPLAVRGMFLHHTGVVGHKHGCGSHHIRRPRHSPRTASAAVIPRSSRIAGTALLHGGAQVIGIAGPVGAGPGSIHHRLHLLPIGLLAPAGLLAPLPGAGVPTALVPEAPRARTVGLPRALVLREEIVAPLALLGVRGLAGVPFADGFGWGGAVGEVGVSRLTCSFRSLPSAELPDAQLEDTGLTIGARQPLPVRASAADNVEFLLHIVAATGKGIQRHTASASNSQREVRQLVPSPPHVLLSSEVGRHDQSGVFLEAGLSALVHQKVIPISAQSHSFPVQRKRSVHIVQHHLLPTAERRSLRHAQGSGRVPPRGHRRPPAVVRGVRHSLGRRPVRPEAAGDKSRCHLGGCRVAVAV